ncbi:MAG: hypothetical protein D6734_11015, partial [Candidatus Schekmanbacteria bacterium]
FLREMSDLIDRYRFTSFMAPRGHGKTFLILGKVIHLIFFNRGKKVLFVSDKKEQASDNLNTLRSLIEENELLKEALVPETKLEGDWSKTKIETKTGCSIVVRANSPSVRGGHYDFVFCDEAGEYSDLSNFYSVIQPTVTARKGKIVVIGTPTSKIDLLHELSSEDSRYVSRKYQAIKANGEALAPDRIPLDELMEIKKDLERKGKMLEWEREYMCNPISSDAGLFDYDNIIKSTDPNATLISVGEPNKRYFMGADFAISKKAKADYSVFLVIEVDNNNNRRIVSIERNKGESFSAQSERFIRMYNNFNVIKACIDESNIGHVFFEKFSQEGLVVSGRSFKAGKGEGSREDLLVRLATLIENGKVIFPYKKDDPKTYNLIRELISELISFTYKITPSGRGSWQSSGAHDDMVMALALAVDAAGRDYGQVSLEII